MNPTDKVLLYEETVEQAEPTRKRWLDRFRGPNGNGHPRAARPITEPAVGEPVGSVHAVESALVHEPASTPGHLSEPMTAVAAPEAPVVAMDSDNLDATLEQLRARALHLARLDAEQDLPEIGATTLPDAEVELAEQCRTVFSRWRARRRAALEDQSADLERSVADSLNHSRLLVDRMSRLTREVKRLKARTSMRKQEVSRELERSGSESGRGMSTRSYALAISFLAVVEYFANAPIFASLLPRDPLTERQIQILSEVSQGWGAGLQRVVAQLVLRPDAALLAAGVITFLCVLGHFFGRSLRDLVTHREQRLRRDTVTGRSPVEHAIPLVLTGLGLALVIGVLFESRVTLGEVGEQRYAEDVAVVEELRRDAGWMRVDGDLMGANERADRADDMEGAALELKEYALSMSRLSFPILLLNLTLILCAICAAYYHRRVTRWEYFDDSKFEDERRQLVEAAEAAGEEINRGFSEAAKHLRDLRSLGAATVEERLKEIATRLTDVVELYRTENVRVRRIDGTDIPAFDVPVSLGLATGTLEADGALHTPHEYQMDLSSLRDRFQVTRSRFNEEAV